MAARSKQRKGSLDEWLPDIAPSTALRKWFGHDPEKWPDFQKRYRAELTTKKRFLEKLLGDAAGRDITLVYASRELLYNNAAVLKEVLQEAAA